MNKMKPYLFFLVLVFSLLCGINNITENPSANPHIQNVEYLFPNQSLLPPLCQSSSTDPILQSTEFCRRIYSPKLNNDSYIYLPIPALYDTGTFDLTFQIHNSLTQIANLTPANESDISRDEQAQSFQINSTSQLASISVMFGPNKQNATLICELRNSTYNGDLLYAKSITFTRGWNNISFGEDVVLIPGKYFLYIAESSKNSQVAWCTTTTNTTDTWVNDGGWESSAYDLALRIFTTSEINPAEIEMQVDSQTVISNGNGFGSISFNKVISGSTLTLPVSYNRTVSFTYSGTAQFHRQNTFPYSLNLTANGFESNSTLPLSEVDASDLNYNANITGFAAEYSNIRLFHRSNPVGYTKINASTIQIVSSADTVLFNSPNSIISVKIPSIVYAGELIPINITLQNAGSVKISLKTQTLELYSELSTINSEDTIIFFIDPSFPSGDLQFIIEYINSIHPGIWTSNITLLKESRITYDILKVEALSRINIACMYVDSLSNNCISGADIDYSIEDLSGSLNTNNHTSDMICFYSNVVDLNVFALTPGIYNISLVAQKTGYRTIIASIPLEITARETEVTVSQDKSVLEPGSNITFSISVHDKTSNSHLFRPVDIKMTIFSGDNIVATEWKYNVIQSDIIQWSADQSVLTGNYKVKTEIYNSYYQGSIEKADAFTVVALKQTNYMIMILVSFGAICGFSLTIVKKKQNVRNSVGGIMVVDKTGTLMAHLIAKDFAHADPVLISGAVTGIMTIIKEITGKGLHTIGVEGGYLNIAKGKSCWVIIFLKQNPVWIKGTIMESVNEIERRYGKEIEAFNGKLFDMSLNAIMSKIYGNRTHIAWENNISMKKLKLESKEAMNYMTPSDLKN